MTRLDAFKLIIKDNHEIIKYDGQSISGSLELSVVDSLMARSIKIILFQSGFDFDDFSLTIN